MANVKLSELPTTTSFLGADTLVINRTILGVLTSSKISMTNALSGLQPIAATLTTLAATSPSALGLNLLVLGLPSSTSYVRVSTLGVPTYKTPSEVLSDIGAQPHDSALDTLSLLTPTLVGQNLLTLDSPISPGFVKVNTGLDNDVLYRTNSQVLSDIAAMPLAYLDTDKELGGGTPSNVKVPSQAAVKEFVLAHSGVAPTTTDTIASSASLDLTGSDYATAVTGSTGITGIVIASGEERVLVFSGAPLITYSSSLKTPTSANIQAAAGGYAVVRGGASGVATIQYYQTQTGGKIHFGGDFSTGGNFSTKGQFTTEDSVVIGADFTTVGSFSTNGTVTIDSPALEIDASSGLTIRAPVISDIAVPASGTLGSFVSGKMAISGTTATLSAGAGSPESAVTAVVGSIFLRTNGGANTTLYVKESGSGNTGWIAK